MKIEFSEEMEAWQCARKLTLREYHLTQRRRFEKDP